MSHGPSPALSAPIRIACGALGVFVAILVWSLLTRDSARWGPVWVRALVTLGFAGLPLALAAFGAGTARAIDDDGEDAMEARWTAAHPWQSRLQVCLVLLSGGFGVARIAHAVASNQRIPMDSVWACVLAALVTANVVMRQLAPYARRVRARARRRALEVAAATSELDHDAASVSVAPKNGES